MRKPVEAALESALVSLASRVLNGIAASSGGELGSELVGSEVTIEGEGWVSRLAPALYALLLQEEAKRAGLPPPFFGPRMGRELGRGWSDLTAGSPLAQSLGWDEASSALERLLDRRLEVGPAGRLSLVGGSTRGRKRRGAWSTPAQLVEKVLHTALDPLIERASIADDPENAILSLRVLDPACGVGRFLVAAARRLAERLRQLRGGCEASAMSEVITHCIYGLDADPMMVELCRASLWLAACDPHLSLSALHGHIAQADALLGVMPALVVTGIPDAAFIPRNGDDPVVALSLQRRNRLERADGHLPPAVASSELAADAWCAAFLQAKVPGAAVVTTSALARAVEGRMPPEVAAAVADVVARRRFWHPHLASAVSSFDLIVGNPPFLNRLEQVTALDSREVALIRATFGPQVAPYTDVSAVFLLRALNLCRPGGRVALVQPQSLLAARDARFVRQAIQDRAELVELWLTEKRLFDASVRVCVPTLEVGEEALTTSSFRRSSSWAPLLADHLGVPPVELAYLGQLGDLCSATADFRDQFYGLAPFVLDRDGVEDGLFPPLITSGLVEPAGCLWGKRPARFGKRSWRSPRVDLRRLRSESVLGSWAAARLVPKVLVATQTKVIEAVVDAEGAWVPAVPLVTVTAERSRLWHLAAALLSPPLSAWALRTCGGTALSVDAIKLSARQVAELPSPPPGPAWDEAARLVAQAHQEADALGVRLALLEQSGELMCDAYGLRHASEILDWWKQRLK